VADSDYLNRSIMVVCGPGGVRERIESATEARRTCDIANIAHAAGRRAVEGDLVLAAKIAVVQARGAIRWRQSTTEYRTDHEGTDKTAMDALDALEAALASAGQEVKHGG
jgi:hypothetical protein